MGHIIFLIVLWLGMAWLFKSFTAATIVIVILVIGMIIWAFKTSPSKKQQSDISSSDNVNSADTVQISAAIKTEYTVRRPTYEDFEAQDEFEDNYSYKADSLMGHYEDACEKVRQLFYSDFDLKHRIKALEKALQKFEEWKDFCYDKGDAGKKYFDDAYSVYNSPYVPGNRDMNGDYKAEYENAEFCNADFLKSVLSVYTTKPDESAAHLLEEHIFYCGGKEEYEFMLKLQSLPKDLLKVIKQNDGILQKDLYGLFDERLKSHIPKVVKDLSAKGKIISVKSGNSYMLRIKK